MEFRMRTHSFRRLRPIAVMALSLLAAVLLLSILSALFALVSDLYSGVPSSRSAAEASSFSLAPPEFLLRLSLFPDQQRRRRLIGVIVENQETARLHHQGLEKALFIEEFNVEGMISRFLAVFDAKDLPPMIGPVRSLRPYFVDASQPWVPVIIHAGGSPEAFERAALLSDVTAINALRYDDGEHFIRADDVPAPHNLFLPTDNVITLLEQNLAIPGEDELKAYPYTLWPPYLTGPPPPHGSGALVATIDYYSPVHNVEYRFQTDGSYLRTNGGTESALRPRNILIIEAPITEIGEFGRLTIPLEGEGKAMLFRSGSVFPVRWSKEKGDEPWKFTTEEGEALRLASGTTWMTQVPSLDRVMWE